MVFLPPLVFIHNSHWAGHPSPMAAVEGSRQVNSASFGKYKKENIPQGCVLGDETLLTKWMKCIFSSIFHLTSQLFAEEGHGHITFTVETHGCHLNRTLAATSIEHLHS